MDYIFLLIKIFSEPKWPYLKELKALAPAKLLDFKDISLAYFLDKLRWTPIELGLTLICELRIFSCYADNEIYLMYNWWPLDIYNTFVQRYSETCQGLIILLFASIYFKLFISNLFIQAYIWPTTPCLNQNSTKMQFRAGFGYIER